MKSISVTSSRAESGQGFRNLLAAATIGVVAMFATAAAWSQNYPSRPVTWIVGYPAGGGSDVVARLVAKVVQASIGQPIVIENRAGAGGTIGADVAAKRAPDGYTFLFADQGMVVHSVGLYKNLPYDVQKDLAPVGMILRNSMLLVAGPSSDVRSVRELVERVKAQPGKLMYASPGAGAMHLSMELLKLRLGLDLPSVMYKGAAPVMQDVVGGQVPFTMIDYVSSNANVKAGKLRVLAVRSKKRWPQFPDVPTIDETVSPGYESANWVGFLAPARTPQEAIAGMNAELGKAVKVPEVLDRFNAFALEPWTSTPREMADVIQSELQLWPPLIRKLGLSAE